jgi:hypothetical protein
MCRFGCSVYEPADIGVAARGPPLEYAKPADDDRQHVVEVMCVAAGRLADGFHFLRLSQLCFRSHALRQRA